MAKAPKTPTTAEEPVSDDVVLGTQAAEPTPEPLPVPGVAQLTEAAPSGGEAGAIVEPTPEPVQPVKAPDPEDTVLDAHLRRQANWEKDAKENPAFAGPDEVQLRREKLVAEVDEMTLKNRLEQEEIAAKNAAATEKATAAQRAVELRAEAEQLTDKASELMAEAERLEQLAKE